MYNGYLIYNASLNNKKFNEIHNMYIESCKKYSINLHLISNMQVFIHIDNSGDLVSNLSTNIDFVLFLDKDIMLAKQLELLGFNVFNCANTIELCDDKMKTTQLLTRRNIAMPKTIFSHVLFNNDCAKDYLGYVQTELEFPLVMKEACGSFGEQVYLIKNEAELFAKQRELWNIPHIYQEYVKTSYGRDVRIYVVNGEVVVSVLRENDSDFRANVTNGGTMKRYEPPEDFKELALIVADGVCANFCGVDVMFGENDEPVFCEVNSNAHIKNVFDVTRVNVADYIVRFIYDFLT